MYEPQRVLAERQRRQQDLLQTLRRMAEPGMATDTARNLLRAYLDRTQHSPDTAYRAWQEALVQEGCRIFSAVHESTTTAQRQQAVRRLRAYQRDLRELSGRV
jgi:alpha-amylase/alpha-mannosidase (GH57 family)